MPFNRPVNYLLKLKGINVNSNNMVDYVRILNKFAKNNKILKLLRKLLWII